MIPSRSRAEQLPLAVQIAYGFGDFGPSMAFNILIVFFFFFLTAVVGLQPNQAGLILFISNVVNAGVTLLVGVLSDRTQSIWGRRRIWMLWSAPVMGISFILHWWIPPLDGVFQFMYYLGVATVFQITACTFLIPYSALLTDLTEDNQEHLKLNSWRFIFTLAGSIGAILLMLGLSFWVDRTQDQLLILGLICGVVTIASILWCCLQTQERVEALSTTQMLSWQDLKELRSNQPLLLLLGIFGLSWMAAQITPTLLPYFATQLLKFDESAVPVLTLVLKTATLVALFIWDPLSRHWGKKTVFWAGACLWLGTNLVIFQLNPDHAAWIYGFIALAGFGMATAYLIPPSMLPEVLDWDEWLSGQRRDGLFNSMMLFLHKITLAVGILVFGQVLSWSGFQEGLPGIEQPEAALNTIRRFTVELPSIGIFFSLVMLWLYPISPARHQQTQAQLQKRRLEASYGSTSH